MREEGQIAPLSGPMDTDMHPKHVGTDSGVVTYRKNLRTGGFGGSKMVNRKIKSTLPVPYDLPAGDNKTIGRCEDNQNDAMVYFVYNSNGDHCVFRYYTKTKTLQPLWYAESELGLINDDLRAEVVNGKVYWVNGSKGNSSRQEPKGFNLEWAANYTESALATTTTTASGSTSTTTASTETTTTTTFLDEVAGTFTNSYTEFDRPFADNIFTLIRRPPQFAPTAVYDSNEDYNFNNLRKKLFQFKYAYQYWDDQVSAWSPISKVPLPYEETGADGEFVPEIYKNNHIDVTFGTGSHRVKKILVAARDTYPRNTGSFFQFEEVEKFDEDGNNIIWDDSNETIAFYNNKHTDDSIDTEVGNRYCDYVPLSARDIINLDGKYLGLAYPEQGYEKTTIDYSLDAVSEEVNMSSDIEVFSMPVSIKKQKLQGYGNYNADCFIISIPNEFKPNATYTISFQIRTADGTGVLRNVLAATDTPASEPANYPEVTRNILLNSIRSQTTGLSMNLVYTQDYSGHDNGIALLFAEAEFPALPILTTPVFVVEFYGPHNLFGNVTINTNSFLPFYKSLKRGQYHPFALIYNDGFGRYNIVEGDQEVYVPLPEDTSNAERNSRFLCQWTIRHRPPLQAKTFRFAYIRNKTYSFFGYFAYVKSTKGAGLSSDGVGIPAGKYFLEINQTYDDIRSIYPDFILSDYVWQNGDRIRVVGEEKSYELAEYTYLAASEGEETEGYLVGAELATHAVIPPATLATAYIGLVEVYRQNPAPQDIVYTEIGEEFEILDPGTANRRHSAPLLGQAQSADLVTPAVGVMSDFGDVYLRQRLVVDPTGAVVPVVVEDEYFNDYYRSDVIDIGRAGAKIDAKKVYLNRVIHGENFIENTQYDRLNVFLSSTRYLDLSDEFGYVTGIENAGDVLKVFQPHKETSIYIGKSELKQADGSETVVAIDRVFDSPRKYVEYRGTTYRNSIAANNRYVYFFDESTGELVRSAPNGQSAISVDYRLRTYFEAKAKALREYSGTKDVLVSVNNDYDEVYVTFVMGSTYETVVFSEDEQMKGWFYYIDLYNDTAGPENFGWYGDTMFSWVNGQLYIHDQGTGYNIFYGKQHYAQLDFYVNKFPSNIKRFKNIRISTDKNIWTARFNIPEGLTYTRQKTRLKPTLFRLRENHAVSDILRNVITKSGSESISLLYRGERMTGEYMKVSLKEQSTEDVELRETEVKFLIST